MKIIQTLIIVTIGFFLATCSKTEKPDNYEGLSYDSIRTILLEIREVDQQMRANLDTFSDFSSKAASRYMGKIYKQDLKNQEAVKQILEIYGWIPESKIGPKASSALFYVVQHSDSVMMARYLPQLDSLAHIGEARMGHYALMKDRLLMSHGKKQIYGSQATSAGSEDGSYYIWPVQNPDSVNYRRAEVGLDTPLVNYARRLGATYDPERKLPELED